MPDPNVKEELVDSSSGGNGDSSDGETGVHGGFEEQVEGHDASADAGDDQSAEPDTPAEDAASGPKDEPAEDVETILVVDDAKVNLKLVERQLANEGYAVVTAVDGAGGLKVLRANGSKIMAAILDVHMPNMNGMQVLQVIRNSAPLAKLPVLMLSSETDREIVLRCIKMGATDYLLKPVDVHLLKRRLRTALDRASDAHLPPASETLVLVVDDDRTSRTIVRRQLEKLGHPCIEADGSRQAMEHMTDHTIGLVFMDIQMPGFDGYTLLDLFKQDSNYKHIPVIMMTSVEDQASIDKCFRLGAADYLIKPVNPSILQQRIIGALLRKQ